MKIINKKLCKNKSYICINEKEVKKMLKKILFSGKTHYSIVWISITRLREPTSILVNQSSYI